MLYVSSKLQSIQIPMEESLDVQDEVTITFTRLTPDSYASLHHRMQRLKESVGTDRASRRALNRLLHQFKSITRWAENQYGPAALQQALRKLEEESDHD